MLAQTFHDHPTTGYALLPDAGSMGTNRAFLGKADGSGQSTKARPQMLAEQGSADDDKKPNMNVWNMIGAQEPSAAANGAMRASDDHGYKVRGSVILVFEA